MPVPIAPQVTLAGDEQSRLESIVRAPFYATSPGLSLSGDPTGRGAGAPVESPGGHGAPL